jgi:hypothetical protein
MPGIKKHILSFFMRGANEMLRHKSYSCVLASVVATCGNFVPNSLVISTRYGRETRPCSGLLGDSANVDRPHAVTHWERDGTMPEPQKRPSAFLIFLCLLQTSAKTKESFQLQRLKMIMAIESDGVSDVMSRAESAELIEN